MVESLAELFAAGRAGLDWFTVQLEAVTGIDVFAEPFQPATGWHVYEQGRFRVLLMRFEDIGRVGPPALQQFLSLETAPVIVHRNEGIAKPYADLYRLFLSTAEIPPQILDLAYESQLARHFYSDDENTAFRSSWERKKSSWSG